MRFKIQLPQIILLIIVGLKPISPKLLIIIIIIIITLLITMIPKHNLPILLIVIIIDLKLIKISESIIKLPKLIIVIVLLQTPTYRGPLCCPLYLVGGVIIHLQISFLPPVRDLGMGVGFLTVIRLLDPDIYDQKFPP